MSNQIDKGLVSIAHDVVNGTSPYVAHFGDGSDFQGELTITWLKSNKFEALLTIYSNPRTLGGYYLDPPETIWYEQEESIVTSKISEVESFLNEYRFSLISRGIK